MNEPRAASDPTGDLLQAWIEEMAAYFRSIDSVHLLTVGQEGFFGPKSPLYEYANPGAWAGKSWNPEANACAAVEPAAPAQHVQSLERLESDFKMKFSFRI